MDKSNTSSRRMPAVAMLAGIFIVFLLSGCPNKQGGGYKINADSLLKADKPMLDSMKAIPRLTPKVISVDSLRKLLGVTAEVHDTTLLRWLRYSTATSKTVSFSPMLPDPSKMTPTVSSFGGDKVPTFWIHDSPPATIYTVMPDFSDHEVSNSFNCVSVHYETGLLSLAGEIGTTIFSWSPGTTGRPFWLAPCPGAVSGCNPSDPASYTPYPLSSNQSVKWSATSGTVKADFVGALNDFAYAPRTSTVRCYLMLENLRWGEVNTMPYSSVSYVTTFFTPTDLVYVLTLND